MKPLKSKDWPASHILNPRFEYRSSAATDVRETFARAREQMEREKQDEQERAVKVRAIAKTKEAKRGS